MANFVVALISFAIAFVAGGALCKAYLSVRGADHAAAQSRLDEQRRRYRKRIDSLQQVISRHEEARQQLKEKLQRQQQMTAKRSLLPGPNAHGRSEDTQGPARPSATDELTGLHRAAQELRAQLKNRDREVATLRKRIAALCETRDRERRKTDTAQDQLNLQRIERDELIARIRRLESTIAQQEATGDPDRNPPREVAAQLRSELGEMRERLALSDRRVHELEQSVQERDGRILQLVSQLDSLKQRVAPLTMKLREQRDQIRAHQEGQATAIDSDAAACDDLKKIRGIGPALEKRLRRQGIRRFEQLAALSGQELAEIAEKIAVTPNLVQRDRWIEQARELAEAAAVSA